MTTDNDGVQPQTGLVQAMVFVIRDIEESQRTAIRIIREMEGRVVADPIGLARMWREWLTDDVRVYKNVLAAMRKMRGALVTIESELDRFEASKAEAFDAWKAALCGLCRGTGFPGQTSNRPANSPCPDCAGTGKAVRPEMVEAIQAAKDQLAKRILDAHDPPDGYVPTFPRHVTGGSK